MNTPTGGRLPRIVAALLNLTGLSLGYFYLRNFKRGGICLGITLALVLFAFLTPGLRIGTLMVILIAAWLVLMAVDGWRMEGKPATSRLPVPAIAGLLVALLLLVGEGVGFAAYSDMGQKQYESGERLYAESQYSASRQMLQSFTNTYHLSLNPHIADAEARIQECDALTAAAGLYDAGDYAGAIDAYQAYLAAHPESVKQSETQNAVGKSYFDWAAELQASGNYPDAIQRYETLLADYPAAPAAAEVHRPLGEAHMQQAAALYAQADKAGALAEYKLVISAFADTPFLDEAQEKGSAVLLEIAQQKFAAKDYNAAITDYKDLLENFSAMPAYKSAKEEIAQVHLAAGNDLFDQQQYQAALEYYNTLLAQYKTYATGSKAFARAAEIHLIFGKQAMAEKDYAGALVDLDTILNKYAGAASTAEASLLAAEAHLAIGNQLKAAGKSEEALEEYDLILRKFASTPSAPAALSASGSVRMEVAALYHSQGKFSEAIALYQQIIREYPGQPETASAGEDLPQVYLDWALKLLEDKNYEQAINNLDRIAQDFATSTAATRVASITVEINVVWGQELVEQEQYIQAIEKLDAVQSSLSDPQLQKIVAEALNTAVQALARDTGTQGKQVIQETISRACDYKVALSPAVAILSGKVYGVVCDSGLTLESKYYPTNPGNFYYAIFIKQGTTEIERCAYVGGHTLIRQQPWTQVTIRNVSSMGIVAQNTFSGGMPEKCENMEWFSSSTKYKVGTYPNTTTMLSWVTGFLKP